MQVALVDTPIAELRAALVAGRVTSEGLTRGYLARIAAFDMAGPRLNSVPVFNPAAVADACASDARRAAGPAAVLGPLDGIPFTAKASFSARGLPVSAGSPAFANLIAQQVRFVLGNAWTGMWTHGTVHEVGLDRTGRLCHRTVARRRRRAAGPDQHAANGQWRHAAGTVWPRREPIQSRVPHGRVRLGMLARWRPGVGKMRRERPVRRLFVCLFVCLFVFPRAAPTDRARRPRLRFVRLAWPRYVPPCV